MKSGLQIIRIVIVPTSVIFFINIHVIESRLSDCDLRFSKAEEDCINNIYDKVLAGFSWHINYFQLILVLISSSCGKGPSLSPVNIEKYFKLLPNKLNDGIRELLLINTAN